ncbi:MAG: translation elongation factor 4 [Candidatus Caenarcaniphilales bacterium]|nr:translation elongation factor 4 [Candidatus Caenarcaniphilales bacterium]
MKTSHIRNFSIIAHIDHGKSTLADRLLEITGAVSKREMQEQLLDNLDLERERGITIKLQTARMSYRSRTGDDYILNLIDTPGHVDFGYEVSRSLAACEGALLIVDATQGVEAQTLSNVYLALENNLAIIPVINKVDLPSADVEKVKKEIEDVIGLDASEAVLVSAKEGIGVGDLLEEIVRRIPPPTDLSHEPARALIFDSYYDSYRGIITMVRIVSGELKQHDQIKLMISAPNQSFEVLEIGALTPRQVPLPKLACGEVGYISASIKEIYSLVGDTITTPDNPASKPLPGYKPAVPMVFCGIYPVNTADYHELKDAIQKLRLNDSSISAEPETSAALGFGFRCGFLGLLHMEVAKERLEREYNLNLIATAPSVIYHVTTIKGEILQVDNPCNLPDPVQREKIEEPWVKASLTCPPDYVGAMMELCQERRGVFKDMRHPTDRRSVLTYELPLAEILTDFFDQLKSRSKGYASLEYELIGYREENLVRLDIKLAGENVDAFSAIVHESKAFFVGRKLTQKLKELIPRQMFEVPVQAAIGSKIVARETISAMRKNVLAKCYGGDITRKKKLLEKQKEGKKKMKAIGSVEVPQEAFLAVLKLGDEA